MAEAKVILVRQYYTLRDRNSRAVYLVNYQSCIPFHVPKLAAIGFGTLEVGQDAPGPGRAGRAPAQKPVSLTLHPCCLPAIDPRADVCFGI